MKSVFYERLFHLNRCLEQAEEILTQFQEEGIIHPVYAEQRGRTMEELRVDLNYVLTGLFHRKELEESVGISNLGTTPGGAIGEP